MAGGKIEATLRIAADVAQAIAGLKQVRGELAATRKATEGGAGGAGTTGASAQATQASREAAKAQADAAAAARQARREQATADREAAALARAAAQEQRRADREALEAVRKAAAEKRRLERQAANELAAGRRAGNAEAQKQVVLAQQVTDSVVGLASGQNPLTVLLQQGGQVRDIFGSIGGGVKAVMALFTPMRVLVLGVAGAFAAVALAAAGGALEEDRLTKAMALTGNAAATTLGEVDASARRIAAGQQTAISEVRDTLASLVATGQYSGATLESAGRAVTALRKLTGGTAEETIKEFDGMGDGVADWAAKHNRAYNFITADQFKHIRTLEAEGRTQEAMRVVMDELTKTMEGRAAPAIGTIERLWRGAGAALSFFVDQLKAIGREQTAEERLAAITKRLEAMKAARDLDRGGKRKSTYDAQIADLEAQAEIERREQARASIRQADAMAAQKETQDEIKRAETAHQNQIAQIDQAGAQKRLAERLSALDAQQSAVDAKYARGLTSELAHNAALNAIEQARLEAQEKNLEDQREIANRESRDGKPEDRLARQAAVTAIDAQLIDVRSRIRVAAGQGRSLVEADALQEARDRAQQWAQAWQQAAQQVRQFMGENAATAASRIADPTGRADAEAAARVAETKRQVKEQAGTIRLAIDFAPTPQAAADLRAQLQQLLAEGDKAVAEQTRSGALLSYQQQLAEAMERVRLKEQEIDDQVEAGALGQLQADQRKAAARSAELGQLDELLQKIREVAATPAERNSAEAARLGVQRLKDAKGELDRTVDNAASNGFATMFRDIVTGSATAGQAVKGFIGSVASSMLKLIAQDLGKALLQSLAPNGVMAALRAGGSFIAGLFHGGGVVGGVGGLARTVSPGIFAGAQVMHTGGLVGLRSNERPIIGKVGEEMLTEDDPRHRNNFRAGPVIGSMSVSLSTDGGGGAAGDAVLAQGLSRGMKQAIEDYVVQQMRPGGLLAGRAS